MSVPEHELDQEDAKLVTLARSSRARVGAAEGAAVRDTDGRTYAACTVALPSLALTALQAAVAAAVAAGADGLEAAAVVGEAAEVDRGSLAAVRDLAPEAPVLLADPHGTVHAVLR
jgi:cytidine deaminase